MSETMIKDGKLYKRETKTAGLAEYLDWAMVQSSMVRTATGRGVVDVHNKKVEKDAWDVNTTVDVRISRYSYERMTDWTFEIEDEVLVDLRDAVIDALVVSEDYQGTTYSFVDYGCVAEIISEPNYGGVKSVFYIDEENGETLKVWDEENGYAWEVRR